MKTENIEYGGDLQYTKKGKCKADIATPKKPYVAFSDRARQYRQGMHIDTKMVTQELLRSGLEESLSKGYALKFHERDDALPRDDVRIGGWHSNFGHLRFIHKKEPVYHVVAVHVVLPQDESEANTTLWHELGHAHQHLVKKVKKDVLYTKKNIKRVERAAVGLGASGVLFDAASAMMHHATSPRDLLVGATTVGVGSILKTNAALALWLADGKERYARKFARQRKHLKPITYRY